MKDFSLIVHHFGSLFLYHENDVVPLSEVERKSMIASARRFLESRGEVAMMAVSPGSKNR